ncbi:aladin [Takifugu rubripes]|uniref:aladin n=1 Tax=Takifugu rubripes TaxID=31033 RepID=UPI000298BE61|nr:aladin [Takifugu rubripes]XP_011600937.1 aladin [Takifugu rubripes]XP_029689750.1 aladin [Takifugu rubripes]|eukprot:XP_003963523.1 PREDICTED: aladin [Takifugu rubripes]
MCSLALFPPPLPAGQTTLCESNNELLSRTSIDDPQKQESSPLSLYFPRESLKLHCRTESSSKAAFLDHSETLWMRSAAAWRDGGFTGLLNEITNSHTEVPKWLSVTCGCILALLQKVSSFHGSLFPHLALSSDNMIAEFSQVLNWSDCVVRAFAWHPHTDKFAVALMDDSIKIYNPKSATTPTLKHRLQRNVAAVQWKPLCASALAVACQNCLLVWHVDPCSLSTRPSSGCAQVLSHPGHSPVTSIAWSPSGSLLLSASPTDTAMMVWDVASESCVPLQRVGGGGVSFLSWSPDGSHVLASTPAALFRVWETRMWTCERWPCLKGRCQSGCWSPDGSRLLFSVQGEMVIYALTFTETPGPPTSTSKGPQAAAVVADLSETTFKTPDGEIVVGGEIQSLAWDPTGERLAVLLKGDPHATDRPAIIAVFKTRSRPIFELLPCGFVQGEAGAEARLMQFHPNFQHGALLTVCWSSGRITHVPFYFLSAGIPHCGLSGSPLLPRHQSRTTDNQSLFTEQQS